MPLTAGESAQAVCVAPVVEVAGIGPACRRADGLLEVFDAEGASLGSIHGADPIPDAAGEPEVLAVGTSPNCVAGTTGTYFIQVIYARASNDADQYSASVGTIRSLVGKAQKLVDDAALITGKGASLNVKCVSGVVQVLNVALPTSKSSATFSTIVADLKAKGYSDAKVKYWVYYDDTGACTCGGMGQFYNDDSLASSNLNNGNGQPLFAVDFGYDSARIWLHELGHTMGAVQNSAGRSTQAGHCYDGADIMCYNDGGPRGGLYSASYCEDEIFDCGKNDYFDATPNSGSYLATHWNLGSTLNRYIVFSAGDTTAPSLSVSAPAAGTVYLGCAEEAAGTPAPRAVYVANACVRATASDSRAGIMKVEVIVGGDVVAVDKVSPYEMEFPVPTAGTEIALTVRATDGAGNTRSVTRSVDMVG